MKRAGVLAGLLLSGFIGAGIAFGVTGTSNVLAADESGDTVNEQDTAAVTENVQVSDTDQETEVPESFQAATGEEITRGQDTAGSDAGNDVTYRDEEKDPDTGAVNLQEENVSLKSSKDTAKPEEVLKTENAPKLTGGVGATRSVRGDIKSISFDRNSAVPGGIVDITVELNSVIDNDSLEMILVNGDKTVSVYLLKTSDGKYEGYKEIDNTWMNGKWSVSEIQYFDRDVWEYDSLDLTGATLPVLKVSDSLEDNRGPVFKSMTFDKSNYKAGDTINVTVTAEDVSGVTSGTIKIGSGDDSYSIHLGKRSATVLTGVINTDNTWKNGTYNVTYLNLVDKLNNDISYMEEQQYEWNKDRPGEYALISSLDLPVIKLSGSIEDREGPVISRITFDKTTAKPGEVVTVTADVSDDAENCSVLIRFCKQEEAGRDGSYPAFYYYLDLAKYSDGTYKKQFHFDEGVENGTYEIFSVSAVDIHGNTFEESIGYDKDTLSFESNKITITDSVGDNGGPKVTDITFDKTRVKPGDKLTVNVTAHDANGVNYVNVNVRNTETGFEKTITCKPDKNGKVKAEITVDDSFDNGKYEIGYNCEAADTLGYKKRFSCYDLYDYDSIPSFEVYDSKEGFLRVKEIKYDKTTVKPGDWVTITAYTEGANDGDTITMNVGFKGEDFYNAVNLKQESKNVFKGKFRIYDSWLYSRNGHGVDHIGLIDSKGNTKKSWSIYAGENPIKCDDLNVINDGTVFSKPVLKSVEFNKEYALEGEEVEVIATLENGERAEYVDLIVDYGGWGTGAWKFSDEPGLGMANLRLYRGNDGTFRGTIKVDKKGEYGVFLQITSAEVVTDKTYDLYYHWENEYSHSIECVKTNKVFIGAQKDEGKDTRTGVYYENDQWIYLENGEHVINYTGYGKSSEGKWVFVRNGVFDPSYTGLAKNKTNGGWFYAENGIYKTGYTGIAKSTDDNLYYVKDSAWDKTYTGLAKYTDGKWYYVKNGTHVPTYTGFAKSTDGKWYYAKNGVWDKTYTGFAKSVDGKWYFARNGKYDNTYTGLAKNASNGGWFYAERGIYKTGYTGIAKSTDDKLYFVKNSKWDKTYTGLAKYTDGKWYYVKNGTHVPTYTGLTVSTDGKYYYAEKGVWDKTYTGYAKNTDGKWYFVRNGAHDSSYTGLAKNKTNGGWFYAENGVYKTGYTGIAKSTDGKLYYVKGSKWDKSYTGLARYTDGKWYYVKNGTHVPTYTGITPSTDGKLYYAKNGVWDKTFTGKVKDSAGNDINIKNGRVV